jgi:hypothetical protein
LHRARAHGSAPRKVEQPPVIFVSVITFSESTCDALLALGDGDSVAMAGELTPDIYTPEGRLAVTPVAKDDDSAGDFHAWFRTDADCQDYLACVPGRTASPARTAARPGRQRA